jgi:predicted molibdopterin-dependent oxidoreductase YjgC
MRIDTHPILGPLPRAASITLFVDGKPVAAREGEPIAAALLANGVRVCRLTDRRREPRGVFCARGQCTDCVMTVDGQPNVRTCITPARDGMRVTTGGAQSAAAAESETRAPCDEQS